MQAVALFQVDVPQNWVSSRDVVSDTEISSGLVLPERLRLADLVRCRTGPAVVNHVFVWEIEQVIELHFVRESGEVYLSTIFNKIIGDCCGVSFLKTLFVTFQNLHHLWIVDRVSGILDPPGEIVLSVKNPSQYLHQRSRSAVGDQ